MVCPVADGARRRSVQWYRVVSPRKREPNPAKHLNKTVCLWLTPLLHSPSSAHCPCRPAHMSMSSMSCLDVPAAGLWIWTQGTQASQDSLSGLSSICWAHLEFVQACTHLFSSSIDIYNSRITCSQICTLILFSTPPTRFLHQLYCILPDLYGGNSR